MVSVYLRVTIRAQVASIRTRPQRLGDKKTGQQLVSPATKVRKQIRRIRQRLGVERRQEALARANDLDILPDD